jgi:hypothetical protein
LAKLGEWDRVIIEANKALEYSRNMNIFSIHYHKALGLCQKGQLLKCKMEAIEAISYARGEQFYYLRDIVDILKSNNIVTEEEISFDERFFQWGDEGMN